MNKNTENAHSEEQIMFSDEPYNSNKLQITLTKKEALIINHWLMYIPDFWQIENLLGKKAKNLNEAESNRLNQVLNDLALSEIIEKYLDNKYLAMNDIITLNNIHTNFDLTNYMLLKFSPEEQAKLASKITFLKSMPEPSLSAYLNQLSINKEKSYFEDYLLTYFLINNNLTNEVYQTLLLKKS